MDLLQSGSERPSLLELAAARVPARAVAAGAAVVLVGGLLAAGPVAQQVEARERRADDVSTVEVRLVLEASRRAGDGSAYGLARLEAVDPDGRDVALLAVDVDLPGLRLGPRTVRLSGLVAAPTVVLPVRFAVPDCEELALPGQVTAELARPGRPSVVRSAPVADGGPGDAGRTAAALRRACGQPVGAVR